MGRTRHIFLVLKGSMKQHPCCTIYQRTAAGSAQRSSLYPGRRSATTGWHEAALRRSFASTSEGGALQRCSPVKGQYEAALGVLLGGRAVAAVSPALQVRKAVVGVVQHGRLV
jgi:hypothetical protein